MHDMHSTTWLFPLLNLVTTNQSASSDRLQAASNLEGAKAVTHLAAAATDNR